MSYRNIIAIALLILSLVCLYPGVTKPMLHLSVSADIPILGNIDLYDKTQSILETIKSLFSSKHHLVAWLILLFSIVIPLLKALMLAVACFLFVNKESAATNKLKSVVDLIAKWSMADVFVVAIFMAFLAAKATPNMEAVLHSGFWWFTAYCLLSILAGQILKLRK